MKKRILITTLLILYLSVGIAFAESVGRLSLENGVVNVRRNNVSTIYKDSGQELEVFNGDEIQTAGNTLLQIRLFQNDDVITVFPNSLFILSNIQSETSEVTLPAGKSRFLIKPRKEVRKNRQRFRLKTTSAIIGVKGTDFVVGVHDGATSLLTLEGVVSLSSIDQPEVAVEVKLNQASQLKQETRPTTPVEVPPQLREAIVASDTPEVFNEVQFGEEVPPVKAESEKKSDGKEESGEPREETAEEATENEDVAEDIAELSEILNEIEEITEEAVEETVTGPTEVSVTITITE